MTRFAIASLMLAGSAEHFYRLTVGELSVATGVFPLSVAANRETQVEVTGLNLPADLKVTVPAKADGEINVPLDLKKYRVRGALKVAVGNLSESIEAEPNDAPATATALTVPATIIPVSTPAETAAPLDAAPGQPPAIAPARQSIPN